MPVPIHFKFTARGVFTNTPEQWSFGFHMSRETALWSDPSTGAINVGQVTAAFAAFLGGSGAAVSDKVKMTDWRAYQISTDNRMAGNPLVVDTTTGGPQGVATNKYPPQVALCATLVANNRGPARFGRFYIPGPTQPLDADMRISNNDATNAAQAVTTLLKSVSDAIDLPLTQGSAEGVNVSVRGGPQGTLQVIDHVEMGRALDTIRTRRNALLEERHVHGHIDW